MRLLRAIQFNKSFVPRKSTKKGQKQKGGFFGLGAMLGFGTKKQAESTVPLSNTVPGSTTTENTQSNVGQP